MRTSPYLILGLAVVLVSFASVLVRLAAAPALSVAFYRVTLASLLLLPFAARDARRSYPALGRRRVLLLAGAGVALALHFATWIASLSYTSIAASALLVNTAPLFAIGLARVFLDEPAPRVVVVATPLALSGAAIIAFGDHEAAPASLFGNLLALAGAVTLAAYHVIGRGQRSTLPLNAYVLGVWTSAAATLGLLALALRAPFHGFEARTWLAFLGLALIPTLGGHGLVNKSLRLLPAPTVGLFLLGEPVGASLLAWLLLAEVPPESTVVGGVVVLAALALVVWGRGRG